MANVDTTAPYRAGKRWEIDPLRWVWRGLTSVRFALGLIGFLALAALMGVVIPQIPDPMRGNPAALSVWYELQHSRFGFLEPSMERLGLFDIFRTYWFAASLGLLVASVCVCTANRLGPVYRNVVQPQTRVPDDYFAREGQTITMDAPDVASISRELGRKRYKVTTTSENGSTYLFADRYPWAQFATFVSHLALILFLAGGFVTIVAARDQNILIGEGETLPVFGVQDRAHMQIEVDDAVGKFDPAGFPLDYRTVLKVFRDGKQVAAGTTTVNRPLTYGGYKIHQTAYFPDGAALQVKDLSTGRVIYDEVLALTSQAQTPRLVVRDAVGNIVLDDAIVPTDFIGDIAGTQIVVPNTDRSFWIGAKPSADSSQWQMVVFETANPNGTRAVLNEGEREDVGGLSLSFAGVTSIPSTTITQPGSAPDSDTQSVAELSKGPQGPLLTVGPVDGGVVALSPGQPATLGNYEYMFKGTREFAGLTVRRDPGGMFIWIATGTFLLGLGLTFYTPRRRLWAKISDGKAAFRGLGGRPVAIERELAQVAARASKTSK